MTKDKVNDENEQALYIGNIILNHLKVLKISQRTLAKETGIAEATISTYTRGISMPSIDNLIKICNALNISMDEFNPNSNSGQVNVKATEKYLREITRKQFYKLLEATNISRNNKWIEQLVVDKETGDIDEVEFGEIFAYDNNAYALSYENMSNHKTRELIEEVDKLVIKYLEEHHDKK